VLGGEVLSLEFGSLECESLEMCEMLEILASFGIDYSQGTFSILS
jgi:hypothetical protein